MNEDYAVVTNENGKLFSWYGQTSVNLFKVQKEIPFNLLKEGIASLVHLKFENMTLRKNLMMIVQSCPHLLSLTFSDVLIDEFEKSGSTTNTRSPDRSIVEHSNLVSIVIKSSTRISKKEHWLIDFLTQSFVFKNLRSLRIQKVYTEQRERDLSFDLVEKYGEDVESNLVSKFIAKQRNSLKELELGGNGIKISEQDVDPKTVEKLQQMKLEALLFSLDAPGLTLFLKTQDRLQTLNCTHIFNFEEGSEMWQVMSSIFECVSSNYASLYDVKLYPVLILDKNRQSILVENILGVFAINCKIFKNCVNLKSLTLGLRSYAKEEDLAIPSSATLMGIRLMNLHYIPTHLAELYIAVEEYSRDELELLANLFPKFHQLRSLYFGTSPLNPLNVFLIKLWWIQSLLLLPEIERIEFHNGRLEDVQATQNLLDRPQNGNVATMSYQFPRCVLEVAKNTL